jgi:hypothetical protein
MTSFLSFAMLLIVGCASVASPPTNAIIRHIPVDSSEQAKKIIENHVRYLRMLFEQSRDPYYGTPKWSEECLKANVVGERMNAGSSFSSASTLILDSKGTPGHCKGESHRVIMLFCSGAKEVQEIKIPHPLPAGFTEKSFCI